MGSGITKSGAEKINPVQVPGSDWKYINMVASPPMDSPNRNAGICLYSSLNLTLLKKLKEEAATLSISPR